MRTQSRKTAAILTLAAALGVSPSAARAAEVSTNGALGCDVNCVDTYEVKCTQASRFLCLTIESHPPADDLFAPYLYMSAIGTVPSSLLGDGFVKIANKFDGYEKTSCFVRPGGDGGMRALVSIFSRVSGAPSDREYVLYADCAKGEILSPEPPVHTKTTIQRKRNE